MPELSRFEGMVIKMLFNDTIQHNKPHVHVSYGEYQASVGIDGELFSRLFTIQTIKNPYWLVSTAWRGSLCSVEQSSKR